MLFKNNYYLIKFVFRQPYLLVGLSKRFPAAWMFLLFGSTWKHINVNENFNQYVVVRGKIALFSFNFNKQRVMRFLHKIVYNSSRFWNLFTNNYSWRRSEPFYAWWHGKYCKQIRIFKLNQTSLITAAIWIPYLSLEMNINQNGSIGKQIIRVSTLN